MFVKINKKIIKDAVKCDNNIYSANIFGHAVLIKPNKTFTKAKIINTFGGK